MSNHLSEEYRWIDPQNPLKQCQNHFLVISKNFDNFLYYIFQPLENIIIIKT